MPARRRLIVLSAPLLSLPAPSLLPISSLATKRKSGHYESKRYRSKNQYDQDQDPLNEDEAQSDNVDDEIDDDEMQYDEEVPVSPIRSNKPTAGSTAGSKNQGATSEDRQLLFDALQEPVGPATGLKYEDPRAMVEIDNFFEKYPATADNLIKLMSSQNAQKKWNEAIESFERFLIEGGNPREDLFNLAIKCCANARRPLQALAFLGEMEKLSLTPSIHTMTSLVSCYCKIGQMDNALQIFERMDKNMVPDQIAFSTLIQGFVKNNSPENAWKYFHEMRYRGIAPDQVTYTIMINACVDTLQAERAANLFTEMKRNLTDPTDFTFTGLIRAFSARSDFFATALNTLKKMKGHGWVPSKADYDALLIGCGTVHDAKCAEIILREMEDSGIEPNLETYAHALHAFAKALNFMKSKASRADILKKTNEIITKIKKRGLAVEFLPQVQPQSHRLPSLRLQLEDEAPNEEEQEEPLLSLLPDEIEKEVAETTALTVEDDVRRVVLAEEKKRGEDTEKSLNELPFRKLLNSHMRILGMCSSLDQVDMLMDLMPVKYGIDPSVGDYTTYMQACAQKKRTDKVLNAWKILHEVGLVPDSKCYNVVLRACARTYRLKTSMKLLEEMVEKNHKVEDATHVLLRTKVREVKYFFLLPQIDKLAPYDDPFIRKKDMTPEQRKEYEERKSKEKKERIKNMKAPF